MTVYPNALPLIVPPPRSDRHEIVFSGNLEYAPNIAGGPILSSQRLARVAVALAQAEVEDLGQESGTPSAIWPGAIRSIEVTGFVEDAVAAIAQSQVAVVPLLAGSGTRIKILEAWAAGTPVVSTTAGRRGPEFRDREHLVLADDAESFTAAVSELLALPVNRERIGAAGRRLYEERYTWPSAWKALDALFDLGCAARLTGNGKAGAPSNLMKHRAL